MSINKKLRTLLIVCLTVILGVVLFNIVHLFSHSVEEYIMNARVEGMSLEELENELGQSGIYGRTYEEGFVIYAKSGECPFYQGNYPRFIPVFPCYSGNFWKICFDENRQMAEDNVYMNLTVAYLDDVSVLENWTNLQSLTILYDDVSEDELQELQQMLPEGEIFVW